MEIRQIRDFLTVVQEGSFAAASRRLHVSQPGLGYKIKQLERELGAKLLERHSRGVRPTEAGAEFLSHAETIMDVIARAKSSVGDIAKQAKPLLRIGLAPTSVPLLGRRLTRMQEEDPRLEVRLREGLSNDLVQMVHRGDIDAAICIEDGPVNGLRARKLYSEYLCLIVGAGSKHARPEPIALRDLEGLDLIAGLKNQIPRIRLDQVIEKAGLNIHFSDELEPGRLRRTLVLSGQRTTAAAVGLFADDIRSGDAVARKIVDPTIRFSVQLVCSPSVSKDAEDAIASSVAFCIGRFPEFIVPAENLSSE